MEVLYCNCTGSIGPERLMKENLHNRQQVEGSILLPGKVEVMLDARNFYDGEFI